MCHEIPKSKTFIWQALYTKRVGKNDRGHSAIGDTAIDIE